MDKITKDGENIMKDFVPFILLIQNVGLLPYRYLVKKKENLGNFLKQI
jgi:hypothetical protein